MLKATITVFTTFPIKLGWSHFGTYITVKRVYRYTYVLVLKNFADLLQEILTGRIIPELGRGPKSMQ